MNAARRVFAVCFAAAVMAALLSQASAQPHVVNASFEADAPAEPSGYGNITGWTPSGGIGTGFGINEGRGPFSDNGAIPAGARVAFMQDNGTLNQTVSGFRVGAQYSLAYRENARGLCCGERVATLSVRVGEKTVVPQHTVEIVGESNPYRTVTSDLFVATHPVMTVTFTKGGAGDSTALIDDVRIVARGK
jgi:hypothetical protein